MIHNIASCDAAELPRTEINRTELFKVAFATVTLYILCTLYVVCVLPKSEDLIDSLLAQIYRA